MGRLGGDEFGVVTIGSNTDGVHVLLRRVQELLTRVDGGRVSISTGIARREPGDGRTIGDVLRAADEGMCEGGRSHFGMVRGRGRDDQ